MTAAASAVAPQIPWTEEQTIKEMFRSEWDVSQPREAQVEGVKKLLSKRSLMFIQPTSSGKSYVFLGSATIRRGISICVTPLHGLGSDQTAKVNAVERLSPTVIAMHADEIRGKTFDRIEEQLLSLNSASLKQSSIIIFTSANALKPDEPWRKLVEHLAKQRLIRVICFDEAHEIPLQGEEFRKEYGDLGKNLVRVVEGYQKDVASYLALTATFPLDLQRDCQRMIGHKFKARMWGMARRNINITVSVVGSPTNALKAIIGDHIKDKSPDESKVLMYTGFAKRASGSLVTQMRKLLGPDGGDAMDLTGNTGIKEKSWLIDLFSGAIESKTCNLQILVGTAAVKCGISSNFCELVACEGFPRSLLELVQLMGRAARIPGSHGRLAVVLSLELYVSLMEHIRGDKESSAKSKRRQLKELFELLVFLVLPVQCQPVTLEQKFSDPDSPLDLGPCNNACCYCRGKYMELTGEFRRPKLIETLQLAFHKGPLHWKHLYSVLNDSSNKQKIWIVAKSNVSAGMVGALVLQLIGSGILRFEEDTSDLTWSLTTDRKSFAYNIENNWSVLNYTD